MKRLGKSFLDKATQEIKRQKYMICNSSLLRSGNILNKQRLEKNRTREGYSKMRREAGRIGSRIFFSCTWNPNRKNARDTLQVALINRSKVGVRKTWMHAGNENTTVEARLSLARCSIGNKDRSLTRTFREHQIFATLSSHNPRWTGNIRINTRRGSR